MNFDIDSLRETVRCRMDSARYVHTLGVERAATALGEVYLPEKITELRCAALLHDITKNEKTEKQLQYLAEFDIMMGDFDKTSPALLHARTAAALITRDFSEYATDDIVNAVRWHTTGRAGMSIFETLIYLADCIEDSREYGDLIRLREDFWGASLKDMSERERLLHLYNAVVRSLDITLGHLIKRSAYIDADTVEFRNYCITLIRNMQTDEPADRKGVDHNG